MRARIETLYQSIESAEWLQIDVEACAPLLAALGELVAAAEAVDPRIAESA